MVERTSAFGAFPTLVSSHPFAEEGEGEGDDDREEDNVTFGSSPSAPFQNTTNSASLFNSGEESSWSEGIVEERQNEGVEYEEDDMLEVIDTDHEDDKEDDLGLKGVESYGEDEDEDEDDAGNLASICTDDGSTAEGPLLWRMDPKNSWSDWKIVVTEEDGSHPTTYHVHKALLASGPRRSRYFRRLFRTDEVADQAKRSCEIKLPHLSANAFPLFLDLVYDQSIRVDHNDAGIRKHAVALYQLADEYGVADLIKEIKVQFIPKIGLDEACPYYQDAVMFNPPVRSFLDHILKICTSNVLRLDPTAPLLRAMEPDFLLAILETERRRRETRVTAGAEALHISRHLSTLIVGYVAYCDVEDIPLPDNMLEVLTRTEYIPSIDFHVVLEWSRIVVPKIMRIHAHSDDPVTTSDPALNIQFRCLESIKGNISKVNLEDSDSEYRDFLKSLPADIAVDAALELTMLRQTAQQDMMTTKYEGLMERNASLEKNFRQASTDLQALQRERDALAKDLGRFELVLPSVGKKSSLKKVPSTPAAAMRVPPGVKMSSAENGHLQVNGRPLFLLRPRSPTTSGVSASFGSSSTPKSGNNSPSRSSSQI